MRKPMRDVPGYIEKLIKYELGSDTKAPPGGFDNALDRAEADLVYMSVRMTLKAAGGQAQTGVVPSGPGWREEASRRVSQPRPQPEVAGPLGHGRDSGARVEGRRPSHAPGARIELAGA
jgi:hypothetical protein